MPARPSHGPRPPDLFWDDPAVLDALTNRDVAGLFRLVQRATGASQSMVASATGLTQAQVSGILGGHRRVTSVDVLTRIVHGLEIPHHRAITLMQGAQMHHPAERSGGVAQELDATQALATPPHQAMLKLEPAGTHGHHISSDVDDPVRSPLHGLGSLSIKTPVPASIGWAEVEHIRYITRAFALSENAYGGGFSGQAAAAQLRHSAQLIEARANDQVRRAVFEAVGNLAGVVGFSAFDVADHVSARRCFDFSLWCAEQAESWPLRASTLSDMARLAIYLGDNDNALSLIEYAQVRSDRLSGTTRAMLSAIRARLLALQGRHAEAATEVVRSDEYFSGRNPEEDPPWIVYYDEAEHQGSTGRALLPIAAAARDLTTVVPRLQAAIDLHDASHPRSRTLSRTRLASITMEIGDPREAASIGRIVLVEASALMSVRLRSEIELLGSLASIHEKVPEVRELRREIVAASRQIAAD